MISTAISKLKHLFFFSVLTDLKASISSWLSGKRNSKTGKALPYTVLINTRHLFFHLRGVYRKIQGWPSLMGMYEFCKKAMLSHALSVSPASLPSNRIFKRSFGEFLCADFVKSKLLSYMILRITIYRSWSNTHELLTQLSQILKVVTTH